MDVKQKALEYLHNHHTVRLATVTSDGQPMAHTVEYMPEGSTLYFVTGRSSRKAVNIAKNPKVGLAIDTDDEKWQSENPADRAALGLQLEGVARQVTDQNEIQKVMKMLFEKHPEFKDMPADPDMGVYRIDLKHGFILDYSEEFGHRDEITSF